jgi:hypothetical protein
MSNEAIIHGPAVPATHDVHHDEHHVHHHKETFITKYVFSQDHKMIAKQFLITGIIWAFLGGLMSVLFWKIYWAIGQRVVKYNLSFIMHWLPCTEPCWCSLYSQPA